MDINHLVDRVCFTIMILVIVLTIIGLGTFAYVGMGIFTRSQNHINANLQQHECLNGLVLIMPNDTKETLSLIEDMVDKNELSVLKQYHLESKK